MKDATAVSSPLGGVRVLEFCHVAAGPFCGMLLSDFGAEVVKVEPPEGDGLRAWPPITQGFSENFASLNRGKKSIALNLKDPADLRVAQSLMLESDVVIENNRPGVMARLGLGYDWISAQKPQIIYCSISAYGQSGPRAHEGGFDLTIQAASGVMSVTGEPGGAPLKCGLPVADFTAGLYAAYTIASTLSRVRTGGPGAHIDVPMFSATLAIGALQTSEYFGTGCDPRKLGSAHPRNAPYEAFRAADGWFAMAAGNNRLWEMVCDIAQTPELLTDERFTTNTLRAANQTALKALLEARFTTQPVAYWLKRFSGAGVPCSAINSYSDALADPQSRHLQLIQPMTLPNGVKTSTVGCPILLNGAPMPVSTAVPALGADGNALRQRVSIPSIDEMTK